MTGTTLIGAPVTDGSRLGGDPLKVNTVVTY